MHHPFSRVGVLPGQWEAKPAGITVPSHGVLSHCGATAALCPLSVHPSVSMGAASWAGAALRPALLSWACERCPFGDHRKLYIITFKQTPL